MNIKDFRTLFVEKILDHVSKEGFSYKSNKQLFIKEEREHIFYVYVHMYKRSTYILVETKIYYGNKDINKQIKEIGVSVQNDMICGGEIKFIMEKYFNKPFVEQYNDLVFIFNENPMHLIGKWIFYYKTIIKSFFEDCQNSSMLNKIINGGDLNVSGFSPFYGDKIIYSYFVAKKAGMNEDKLKELLLQYEQNLYQIEKKHNIKLDYLDDFFILRDNVLKKNNTFN